MEKQEQRGLVLASDAPPGISGTCKSSPDGKHKPKWEEE